MIMGLPLADQFCSYQHYFRDFPQTRFYLSFDPALTPFRWIISYQG